MRRTSLIDEEDRQLRIVEIAVGTSNPKMVEAERSTINCGVFAEDTTDGVPITVGVGFDKPDPSACCFSTLCSMFASPITLLYILLCSGDNCMSFCWGGVNGK